MIPKAPCGAPVNSTLPSVYCLLTLQKEKKKKVWSFPLAGHMHTIWQIYFPTCWLYCTNEKTNTNKKITTTQFILHDRKTSSSIMYKNSYLLKNSHRYYSNVHLFLWHIHIFCLRLCTSDWRKRGIKIILKKKWLPEVQIMFTWAETSETGLGK